MTHCSDDELLLEYYGESSASSAHIASCGACGARSRDLKATLDAVTLEPPDRGERYGLEVWQAIRHRLPLREPRWRRLLTAQSALAAAAAVVLLLAGYSAGRLWPRTIDAPARPTAAVTSDISGEDEARRRIMLLTVTDHFDRSDRVLAEVLNAAAPRDLSAEQQWARDLVAASRLYRQHALDIDEPAVAGVLDELERGLLDIVHQPSRATAANLEEIRRRIDSAALLFKVRVMADELQQRLQQPPSDRTAISTSTIG